MRFLPTVLPKTQLVLALTLTATALTATPSAAPSTGAPPAVAASSTYDFSLAHSFQGYGANAWISGQNLTQRDLALDELHLTRIRSAGPRPAIPPSVLGSGGQSVAQLLDIFRAHQQTPASVIDALATDMTSRGIVMHQIVWRMPEPWVTVVPNCNGTQDCYRANMAHLDDYVRWIVAEVLYAREYDMPVGYVELTNEPDGNWNTLWTAAEYAELVERARIALDANGLQQVGIEGPGTGTQRNAVPFLQTLVSTGAIDHLAAVSVHDYDTSYTDRCDERECLEPPIGLSEEFQTAWDQLGLDLPINVTEYTNRDRTRWNAPPYDCADGAGSGRVNGICALNTPEYGLWLATEGLKLAADGASTAIQWELQDLSFNPVNWGLMNINGGFRPSYRAFKAFQLQLDGATRAVRGSTSTKQTVTAAFDLGDEVLVVISNLTSSPVSVTPVLTGLSYDTSTVRQQLIYSGTTGLTTTANVVDPATRTITVPGQSLVAVRFGPPTTEREAS